MWAELARALQSGAVIAYGAGLSPGWAAWLAARAARRELVVVVARDDVHARELTDDINFFDKGDVAILPGIDVSPYADLSPDRSCIVERIATLYRLTQPELRPRLLVTSAVALAGMTVPRGVRSGRGRTF